MNRSAQHARVTPVLSVADVRAAVDWYYEVFNFAAPAPPSQHGPRRHNTVEEQGSHGGSRGPALPRAGAGYSLRNRGRRMVTHRAEPVGRERPRPST